MVSRALRPNMCHLLLPFFLHVIRPLGAWQCILVGALQILPSTPLIYLHAYYHCAWLHHLLR